AASAVDALIDAIGTVELTEACKAAIGAARAAYDALTDVQKPLVEKLDVLEAAEQSYADLEAGAGTAEGATVSGLAVARGVAQVAAMAAALAEGDLDPADPALPAEPTEADRAVASAVDAVIGAIGTVELTEGCRARIDAAQAAYASLTEVQKGLVTKLADLTAAEQQYRALEEEAKNPKPEDPKLPKPEQWQDVTDTVTDGNGYYRFDNLPVVDEKGKPYEYRIRMVNPAGAEYIAAVNVGGDDNADNDLHPADGTADSAGMGYTDPLEVLLKRGSMQAASSRAAADVNGTEDGNPDQPQAPGDAGGSQRPGTSVWVYAPTAYGHAFQMLNANQWTREAGQAVDPAFYLEPPKEDPEPPEPVVPDPEVPEPPVPDDPKKPATPLPKPPLSFFPQTGDSIAMVLAMALVAAAALALLLVAWRRRKKEEEE
ncbi:LPXTG cell wall anchor domain-containing protein, partial [Adlercreutzia aquisgranensis]|uniref:LPXTG cell wall anchor domain-containing protein n=1 Tax=Adlercreutzia aquisgranensis TaxID=2941323 RepID=UPI00203B3E56